ncbi:MAG: uroporphyrinogen-III C-methyltransferase [Geodermatophilaceae bacterium]|nr:uroporphyrinogen-III C-methyltransferase [Geodermatophilaceae bacterium]
MTLYPVALRLTGRRVTVVGGGRVAARRVLGLLEADADVVLVSPTVTTALEALSHTGRIKWLNRTYAEGDLAGAWYVVAATDERAVNSAVAEESERRGVFCARADDAVASSAWTPALGRYDGITVAVSGERDPKRAAGVRDEVVRRLQDGSLAAPRRRKEPGVVLVGGGPGDPGLITVRGWQALRDADVVVADHLAPQSLLDELGPDVEVVDASKLPYRRSMAQERINELLVSHARAGRYVVRLKGGDPMVFGRGFEEVLACASAGVRCEVVPGVSSAVAVPALAGVPVTHRGIAHEVVVVSGHVAPGDPTSRVDWTAIGRLRGTLVLLMAMTHLEAIAETLIHNGRGADTPVAVICDGSTSEQRTARTTLGEVAAVAVAEGLQSPAVVVIGDVVGLGADLATRARPTHAAMTPTREIARSTSASVL